MLDHTTVLSFFPNTPIPEIYTLSLHDALPILNEGSPSSVSRTPSTTAPRRSRNCSKGRYHSRSQWVCGTRSEEHTSELQSHSDLVCRLLLEKKNKSEAELGLQTKSQKQTSRRA